jgi:DNA-binding MurR/RpiR family transcriptional regulator
VCELISKGYQSRIKNIYNSLRASEKLVAKYVLLNGYVVSSMPIARLAQETGVSEPTVMRFVKSLGCKGYSDFKLNLMKDWGRVEADAEKDKDLLVDLHITEKENISDIPGKMIGLTIKALEDTLKIVDTANYKKAVAMIKSAGNIDVYGVGNSGSVASDIMNKFLRIGLNCRAYPDNHLQQISASHLKKSDLAIAVSHSGSTIDTVDALRIAREAGAKTIALTNFKGSIISAYADITLYTGDIETTFYSETMISRISQLAIVDILYMGVLLSDYVLYTKRLDKVNLLVEPKNYIERPD